MYVLYDIIYIHLLQTECIRTRTKCKQSSRKIQVKGTNNNVVPSERLASDVVGKRNKQKCSGKYKEYTKM
jgi:hypothetical protein